MRLFLPRLLGNACFLYSLSIFYMFIRQVHRSDGERRFFWARERWRLCVGTRIKAGAAGPGGCRLVQSSGGCRSSVRKVQLPDYRPISLVGFSLFRSWTLRRHAQTSRNPARIVFLLLSVRPAAQFGTQDVPSVGGGPSSGRRDGRSNGGRRIRIFSIAARLPGGAFGKFQNSGALALQLSRAQLTLQPRRDFRRVGLQTVSVHTKR
jgi:hypothetical protein